MGLRTITTTAGLALAVAFFGCAEHAGDPAATTDAAAPPVEDGERAMDLETADLYPELASFVRERAAEFDRIAPERRTALEALARSVAERKRVGEPVRLTFICTHNSRRSHLSQLWAQAAAHAYGVTDVETFSGGTEATAFNPRAVAAARRAGFEVAAEAESDNPVYRVRFSERADAMECFSKVYDQPPNPDEGFFAVMTCSAADAACPIVFGAVERVSIPYDDPKSFDGTEREQAVYDERCRQIAREMLYAFSRVEAS